MKSYAILLDTTLCTGCNTCLYKCIQENMRHDEASRGLFRTIAFIRDTGIYHQRCMHCVTPDCVDVCPEGALTKPIMGRFFTTLTCASGARPVLMPARFPRLYLTRLLKRLSGAACVPTGSVRASLRPVWKLAQPRPGI